VQASKYALKLNGTRQLLGYAVDVNIHWNETEKL
jgi:hypothetical protein